MNSAYSPTIKHALIGNECSAKQKKEGSQTQGRTVEHGPLFLEQVAATAGPGRVANLPDSRELLKPVNWYQGGSI